MSTPQAKRRRLNEAAKTLHKPFKSPFRTPLKPSIGSDPPSSDPPDLTVSEGLSENTIGCKTGSDKEQGFYVAQPPRVDSHTATSHPAHPLASQTIAASHSRSLSKRAPSKPSITREIVQLRSEVQMLTQAHSLATSTKDDDLLVLIDRWRTASRAAAEELFGSTRDRVNRMGGVGAWQQRERDSKERQKKWDQEEMEAERERMEEARENGEVSEEAFDRYAELSEETIKEEKPVVDWAEDDSFTMDMMLKTLNIDLDLIGYNKEAQRWEG
ncbi:hypothetical protein ACN47E_002218 [Coniothyrium glycines]